MELKLSREQCKREPKILWEAELTHLPLCETELLNWAKTKSYILIQFLDMTLYQ